MAVGVLNSSSPVDDHIQGHSHLSAVMGKDQYAFWPNFVIK